MKKAVLLLMLTVPSVYLQAQSNPAGNNPKTDSTLSPTGGYKVAKGIRVDQLLKKMNGFEIGDDGTVFHNGQQINIAKINGKDYKGTDIAKIIKRMPADRVENIEVITDENIVRKVGGIRSDIPQEILNIIINDNGMLNLPGYTDIYPYRQRGRRSFNDGYITPYGEPTLTDPRNPLDRYIDRAIANTQAATNSMYEVNEWGDQVPHFVIKEWPGAGNAASKKSVKNKSTYQTAGEKPVQP